MAYYQWVDPNPYATDDTGMCLRFVQRVFHNLNPIYYESATAAWEAAVHKSYERNIPTDVAVVLWFSHTGTYGNPPVTKDWGHTGVNFPGIGINMLSSPTWGHGQEWFSSIEAVERAFNCKFRGWSLDVGGLIVAWPQNVPIPGTNPTPPGPTPIPPKPKPKELKVQPYHQQDVVARKSGKTLQPGTQTHLNANPQDLAEPTNVVGKVGYYVLSGHIRAEGTPGDQLEMAFIWDDSNLKPRKTSPHYEQTVTIGPDGRVSDNPTFQRMVRSGLLVYLRVTAKKTNKGPVKVTLLDSDTLLHVMV